VEFNLSFSELGQYFSGHAKAYTMLLLPAIILAILGEILVMQVAVPQLSLRPEYLLRPPDWTPS